MEYGDIYLDIGLQGTARLDIERNNICNYSGSLPPREAP
jgi:hypothetical protein